MLPILPPSERWTAPEATSWIAFGKSVKDITPDVVLPRERLSHAWKSWPSQELLEGLRAIEATTALPHAFNDGPLANQKSNLSLAEEMVRETGESAAALADALERDWDAYNAGVRICMDALHALTKSVQERRLLAWGRPAWGENRPNMNAVHELLRPELFDGPRLISMSGWVDYGGPPEGFGWLHYKGPWFDEVRFDAEQVMELWPSRTNKSRQINDEDLNAWMLSHAQAEFKRNGGKKPKRQALIELCVKETRARHEDAERAHLTLPDQLRRVRGERG